MLDVRLKFTTLASNEADLAKEYWRGPHVHPTDFREGVPTFYSEMIAQVIFQLQATSIFEFGCNAGRNLVTIRRLHQLNEKPVPRLAGCDINPHAVEYGRTKWGLDIQVGDETLLEEIPRDSFDVSITVSVLDHLPDFTGTLGGLVRVTKKHLVLLEPHSTAGSGKVAEIKSSVNTVGGDGWIPSTPFTYIHNYDRAFLHHPLRQLVDMSLPTHLNKVGPLYRLRVMEKVDRPAWPDRVIEMLLDRTPGSMEVGPYGSWIQWLQACRERALPIRLILGPEDLMKPSEIEDSDLILSTVRMAEILEMNGLCHDRATLVSDGYVYLLGPRGRSAPPGWQAAAHTELLLSARWLRIVDRVLQSSVIRLLQMENAKRGLEQANERLRGPKAREGQQGAARLHAHFDQGNADHRDVAIPDLVPSQVTGERRELEARVAEAEARVAEAEARVAEAEARVAEAEACAAEAEANRRKAEVELDQYKTWAQHTIADLQIKHSASLRTVSRLRNSVTYRVGRAMVEAACPSRNTLLLPVRLVRIALQHYRDTRRRASAPSASPTSSKAQKHLVVDSDTGDVRKRAQELVRQGRLTDAFELLERSTRLTEKQTRQFDMLQDKLRLLRGEVQFSAGQHHPPLEGYTGRPRTALYVLHNSLPYNSGGYATRAHGILTGLTATEWDVTAVTRLGYPSDRVHAALPPVGRVIDGAKYTYLDDPDLNLKTLSLTEYISQFSSRLEEVARSVRPVVLHAASFFHNGIAANLVGQRLGIPSIYEIRGMHYLTRSSHDPGWKDSDESRLYRKLELQAAQDADLVLTLTGALRELIANWGVPRDKIYVFPNGVDTQRFAPTPPDRELQARLGLEGKVVIGYVGSFVFYEGLDYLLEAAAILKTRRDDFKLLLVGDGEHFDQIAALVRQLGLEGLTVLTGRVPHEEVVRYHSLVDIAPFPRKGLLVCETVSPIKPLEAMAMGKAVVASSVAALCEMVHDSTTGLVHEKDKVEHLAAVLEQLIRDPGLRKALGVRARDWVVQHRDWRVLTRELARTYERLTEGSIAHRR
ncbi:glycosyltransferase involved in cell wall biosynthesis/uncharacterized coiled-coil protein SlyX [Symbiobacterium terraclitae]|uniref:Glycosyltransferase involved in cell wall biosynthesis/uncharacterized coiled-coil protein SlyX n=1 Tax=Symbiobacterium terraclitae TaxID=557451 RepID=A0ABS4JS99_9FIRM|nr:glycosyltransferase involved in cell wall biosynthesis/uncharacterized coiled-coil protein SlyX [Symbiobacterium terraclitae]